MTILISNYLFHVNKDNLYKRVKNIEYLNFELSGNCIPENLNHFLKLRQA